MFVDMRAETERLRSYLADLAASEAEATCLVLHREGRIERLQSKLCDVVARAKALADMRTSTLRIAADYEGMRWANRHRTRGELIELILIEETTDD